MPTMTWTASGENWGAFVSNADIAAVFDAIISGGELTSEFVRRSAIVFVRLGVNSFAHTRWTSIE